MENAIILASDNEKLSTMLRANADDMSGAIAQTACCGYGPFPGCCSDYASVARTIDAAFLRVKATRSLADTLEQAGF